MGKMGNEIRFESSGNLVKGAVKTDKRRIIKNKRGWGGSNTHRWARNSEKIVFWGEIEGEGQGRK